MRSVFIQDLLCVIVLYKMRFKESAAWQSLCSQNKDTESVIGVFVYDNSPEAQPVPDHTGIKVYYHHNAANAGVGIAYNDAHALAASLNKNWLLLLDQDTSLPSDALLRYEEAHLKNPSDVLFAPSVHDQQGVLSPFRFSWGSGKRPREIVQDVISLHSWKAINSGLLIRIDAFRKAGGYDPALPLDFSDIAFLHKIQQVTDRLVVVPLELKHDFSGSRLMELPEAIQRFTLYCQGAKHFDNKVKYGLSLQLRCFLRVMKLSMRYSSMKFVSVYWKIWHR
ncbi:MAG: hypothetical protein K2U26_03070 [Cyclobacteriaceae bacterium]|nr:hypothetical protein [Cyclobacteriaceae bacterium]